MRFLTKSMIILMVFFSGFLSINHAQTDSVNALDIGDKFIPSGYMGDGESGNHISLISNCEESPHSLPSCYKIKYIPGDKGWAGVFWQNIANNWGKKPGTDLHSAGFTKLTFYAKGTAGCEKLEFKTGGINNANYKYNDSYEVSLGTVTLTLAWHKYQIDLREKDLSSVIGAFCWVANSVDNPKGFTIYLDDVRFER